jgi:hypothetical protein
MNVPLRPPPTAVARHKITLAEARRMWDARVFPDYPDLELIDGELYEMPSDCQKRRVLVFRPRADGRFGEPEVFEADRPVDSRLIPSLALRLGDLHLPT